jgi:preprotein translocase subunit SecF
MKKVVEFTKLRYFAFIFSSIVLIAGIAGTVLIGGFNFGIDFKPGLTQRVQLMPAAASVVYTGNGTASLDVTSDRIVLTKFENRGEEKKIIFFSEAPNLSAVAAAVSSFGSFTFTAMAGEEVLSSSLIGFSNSVNFSGTGPVYINYKNKAFILNIEQVRAALTSLGKFQIQVVGDPADNEYFIRIEDANQEKDFREKAQAGIAEVLNKSFGAEKLIVKQTDFVGPSYSASMSTKSWTVFAFTIAVILIYIWLRFKLAYGLSAIIALIHDVIIMLGFIGITQLEFSTATIAAVLTLAGYSINDTIVVFDRIRENTQLMRDSSYPVIINTSITQSLSRTLITSVTTLIAVIPLAVFASGPVRVFSIAMIFGIVVGTYSSIFIASQFLLVFKNFSEKQKKNKEALKNLKPAAVKG